MQTRAIVVVSRVQCVHRAPTRKSWGSLRALVRVCVRVCVAAVIMVGDACRLIVISVPGRLLFDGGWWLDLHK